MTIFPHFLANLRTICVILSCFHGIYILLSMNFQGNILTIIPQLTALMHLVRFTIILTIFGLILLFVDCINNGMKLLNNMCTDGNCKIFCNISSENFNYTISMNLALIMVHLYFYTSRNDNYNITNADLVIICKFLYSYIMFDVNYDKLNDTIIMTIILQSIRSIFVLRIIIMIIIIIALFGLIPALVNLRQVILLKNIYFIMYYVKIVIIQNINTFSNQLQSFDIDKIVFEIAIMVVFNILKNVLNLLINSVEKYHQTGAIIYDYNNNYHNHIFYNTLFHMYKKEKIILVRMLYISNIK